MVRLRSFTMELKTGDKGYSGTPKFSINGFPLYLDEAKGGTGSGQTFEAKATPDSFPHALLLCGPAEGTWDIEEMTITYYPHGEEPYTLHFGSVALDSESDLNIWHNRPAPVYDV